MRLGLLCLVLLSALAAPLARSKPNIVVILADDQGWGDLSINGNANLATPHIDSLGRDGAILERFYVSPVCSPTRAELLTGRYHPRGGIYGTSAGKELLDLDETTIAEVFQAAGYATGAFGKWHNGSQFPYHPNARGFDEYYGAPSGHWAHYFSPPLDHNNRRVRGEGYVTDDFTDRAIAFIERHQDGPFLCYVPYNTPHSPMQVPDRFYEKFADLEPQMRHRDPEKEDLAMTRAALAMVENIDWNVGRILKRLDELDLRENTIVIYFSDNGPNSWRWNGDMRGRKGSTDEGGVRSPFLIRWPDAIEAGGRIPQIAAAIDLLPTLTDLADVELATDHPLDGVSLAPLLRGEADDWPERMIFSHQNSRVSVRTQRFRLDNEGRLYDMADDPGQRRNVAEEEPETAERLRAAVREWSAALLPGLGKEERPFIVGAADRTWLPARDAAPSGGVERSNRFPNSSYFRNWSSTEGRVTWNVKVAEPGRYRVRLFYACPAEDVGSTIELRFQGNRLQGEVVEAHDPPLIGAAQDRVPRQESYTKDFRPLELGEIELTAGRGPLELRALEIPGSQALEVSSLELFRK